MQKNSSTRYYKIKAEVFLGFFGVYYEIKKNYFILFADIDFCCVGWLFCCTKQGRRSCRTVYIRLFPLSRCRNCHFADSRFSRFKGKKSDKPKPDYSTKELIRDGFVCGFFLAGTSAFQQLGLFAGTPSGKAGFLTSCNVIFVPIICLFFKDKIKWNVWLSIVVTVCGLYLLCVNDGFSVQMSDVLVLICSVMNAARIIAVDRFKHKTDIIKLACVQFFSASLFLTVPMAISEMRDFSQWCASINQSALWMSLLYAGVIAGTFAFTVQNVAQKYVDPTVSSLLMSTESVFAVLAGWLIMGDKLTVKELIGCAIIFVALVIAQLPNKKRTESVA